MKRTVICFLIALACFAGTFANAEEKVVDGVVAVVNGDIVTMYDMNAKMAPILKQFGGKNLSAVELEQVKNIREQILHRYINEMIIDQEAKRLKVAVSDKDVEGEVNRIKVSSNLNDEEFNRQLKLQKTNFEEFKDGIRKDIRKHRLLSFKVKNKVVVTEEEIQAVWNSTKVQDAAENQSVHLKLILFSADISAEKIREKIISGEITFEEAADKYTTGPGAGSGGDLGVLEWGDLAKTWHDALTGLNVGDMSQPFEVQSSLALLKLDSYAKNEEDTFAENRDEIYDRLYREKQDAVFADYIKKLREKAVIQIK